MSALAPPAPTPPPAPRPLRITAAQFNHMGDMGWFEGRRAFLLDGVILEQGPMDTPHAVALGLTQAALQRAFPAGFWVRVQSPFHTDEFTDPEPDLAVVPGGPRDYLGKHPTAAALVVEVADSSLATDARDKAERYATAGVADYWVVDVVNGRVLVFRDPRPLPASLGATTYKTCLTLGPGDTVSPLAAPGAAVAVADLLP
jgi:Uma2 family endonuclease